MTHSATSLRVTAIADAPLTMSSREIAELVEARHDSVKRAIERLAERGTIVQPPLVDEQDADVMGRKRTTSVYRLDKRSSFIVVAQLSPEFTARLVDRWQELEALAVAPAHLTGPQLMAAALIEADATMRAQAQEIAEMRPAVQALGRISQADGSLCITDAAKALQVRPTDLFTWLRGHGWIYRRPGGSGDLGYQSKVVSGVLEHKVTTVLRADGSEKVTEQVRITAKGLTRLAQLVPSAVKVAV